MASILTDKLGNQLQYEYVTQVFIVRKEAGVRDQYARAGYDRVTRTDPDGSNPRYLYRPITPVALNPGLVNLTPSFEVLADPPPRDPSGRRP